MQLEAVRETRHVLLFLNCPARTVSMRNRAWGGMGISTHFVQFHEPLSQSIHLISIDCCEIISSIGSKQVLCRQMLVSQFEPCMMLSSI